MREAEEVNPSHNDQIRELLRQLEQHSTGEAGHAERVSVYSVAIGEKLGLGFEDLIRLRQAAALHDVGKIGIDQDLLQKSGGLSSPELAYLRTHAKMARDVLEAMSWLQPVLPSIIHHHEQWNGNGYPDGLKGEEIPLGARIIAVAEAFDVLSYGTPYRAALSEEDALAEIRRCSGNEFDPKVVDAFLVVQPLIQPVRV